MMKKLALTLTAIALVTAIGVATVGTALAQTTTPPAQTTPDTAPPAATTKPKHDDLGLGRGLGFKGGDSTALAAAAEKLGMTTTELTEALRGGKTLSELATEKGVDLATIQAAINASRVTAMKERLAQAVTDGTMTQEEADWWTTGIDKGWVNGGRGGFGMLDGGGRHGRGGGLDLGTTPKSAPTAPATGSSS